MRLQNIKFDLEFRAYKYIKCINTLNKRFERKLPLVRHGDIIVYTKKLISYKNCFMKTFSEISTNNKTIRGFIYFECFLFING